jgi:hypothetical protein
MEGKKGGTKGRERGKKEASTKKWGGNQEEERIRRIRRK